MGPCGMLCPKRCIPMDNSLCCFTETLSQMGWKKIMALVVPYSCLPCLNLVLVIFFFFFQAKSPFLSLAHVDAFQFVTHRFATMAQHSIPAGSIPARSYLPAPKATKCIMQQWVDFQWAQCNAQRQFQTSSPSSLPHQQSSSILQFSPGMSLQSGGGRLCPKPPLCPMLSPEVVCMCAFAASARSPKFSIEEPLPPGFPLGFYPQSQMFQRKENKRGGKKRIENHQNAEGRPNSLSQASFFPSYSALTWSSHALHHHSSHLC